MAESRGSGWDMLDWLRSCSLFADNDWSNVQQTTFFKSTIFVVQKCAFLRWSLIAIFSTRLKYRVCFAYCIFNGLSDRDEPDDR